MGRLIGYARVSTAEQDLQLQLDALHKAGCVKVFEDKASGARSKRPGLDACVAALKSGDTLVVWRLDRLGRLMPHLVGLAEELLGKGIGFRSLLDGAIDTTHRLGRAQCFTSSRAWRSLSAASSRSGQPRAWLQPVHVDDWPAGDHPPPIHVWRLPNACTKTAA